MKKKNLFILFLFTLTLFTTGCLKRDNLEGIEIVTTVYPVEYITNYLYGEHAIINSIYPDGVNTTTYTLNEKQSNDYSKKDLFIYNRITNDKDIALDFTNRHPKILLIDATYGMNLTYGEEELWLNPSNLLMLAQNIKNGLKEFITNSYLEKEIDTKYEELNVSLSELDAEFKLTAENATRKTLVVNHDSLRYLEKYGFTVISLDNTTSQVSEKVISDVIQKIKNNEVRHLFLLEKTENNDIVNQVLEETQVETYIYRKLDNITDSEREERKDYFEIMDDNLELLRNELY